MNALARKHLVFGDWRDLRGAIEASDPSWLERPEEERQRLWDWAKAMLAEYQPLKVECGPFGCGQVIAWWEAYRCADCRATYCENCIKPHFGPGHRPHQ